MSFISRRQFMVSGCLLAMAFTLEASAQERGETIQLRKLTPRIAISGQPTLANIRELKRQGFATIVDFRPDGEAPDQPPSAQVEEAARSEGMRFFYIPVVNSDVPQAAVEKLEAALKESDGQVLLYCRSGRRAARAWSLAEASRAGGLDAGAILAAVKGAGQPSDDLEPAIRERIARRSPGEERK